MKNGIIAAIVVGTGLIGFFVGRQAIPLGPTEGDVVAQNQVTAPVLSTLQDKLLQAADEVRLQLPMMLDEDTKLYAVDGADMKFRYSYELVNIPSADLSDNELRSKLAPMIRQAVCNNDDMAVFRNNNIPVIHQYYGNDKALISSIITTTEHCS
uniref:hypothetical protein n=1 Tax=Thaumasiovibrio occultus TaxID=1891184 RepID=UPI000B35680F|nr:hypothetical protein [Thaumasiovibrio occultus]